MAWGSQGATRARRVTYPGRCADHPAALKARTLLLGAPLGRSRGGAAPTRLREAANRGCGLARGMIEGSLSIWAHRGPISGNANAVWIAALKRARHVFIIELERTDFSVPERDQLIVESKVNRLEYSRSALFRLVEDGTA